MKYLLSLLFVISLFDAGAQTKKGKKQYEMACQLIGTRQEKDAYKGLDILNNLVLSEPSYILAWEKMAETYRVWNMFDKHNGDLKRCYQKIKELQPNDPKYVSVYYNLAEVYLREGNYSLSKPLFDQVLTYPSLALRMKQSTENQVQKVNFALEGIKDPFPFEPKKLSQESVNRFQYNSHPVLTADQQVMVLSVKNDQGNRDENIVICKKEGVNWMPSENISVNINSPRNEGMATISGDGKTLVFSSCYREDSKGGCDLYLSKKVGEEWSKPLNLGPKVNSPHKESEPTLSADGRVLYFSSDRNAGFGYDLYITKLDESNEWKSATNLGPTINTKYDEVTPFLHADGKHLYFASNGHIGFGGYDNFVSEIEKNSFTIPKNLGFPLNTASNEGSIYITNDFELGYFEKYEKLAADSRSMIYQFQIPDILKEKWKANYIKGKVVDAKTKKPLFAEISVTNLKTNEQFSKLYSDSINGKYLAILVEGQEYALHADKIGYLFYSMNFNLDSLKNVDNQELDIELMPIELGSNIVLNNIFYATDAFQLLEKSKFELNKLASLLKRNPNLKLSIEGHTDNQGQANYNQTLSINRAKTVVDYLVNQGIDIKRLSSKGLGSSKPLASNENEEGRAKNRRIEMRVVGF